MAINQRQGADSDVKMTNIWRESGELRSSQPANDLESSPQDDNPWLRLINDWPAIISFPNLVFDPGHKCVWSLENIDLMKSSVVHIVTSCVSRLSFVSRSITLHPHNIFT